MSYVVTEACIKCKYMDCVEVCPLDCFYEGENMLQGLEQWLELNPTYSAQWPTITRKGETPAEADAHKDEADKFNKYFRANPGGAKAGEMEQA
jgi:ferredoxin